MNGHMPVMDGFAAAERLREAERGRTRTPVARIDVEQIEGLAELRTPDGGSLLTTFVCSFARRADHRLDTIRGCVARADDEALVMAAHELKGSAALIGAVRVAALCGELEHGGSAVLVGHPAVLDELATELELAMVELDAIARRAA